MNGLVRKSNGIYKEYEDLLLRRDQLLREAGSIKIAYMKEFGEYLLEAFELKIDCIRLKKMIAFCQAAINRGELVDEAEMNEQISRSMALYEMQLKEMITEKIDAELAGKAPAYKAERARRIYRRLAKMIHPDISPLISENEHLRDLWERIVIAYNCCDDEELGNLEVLVRKVIRDSGTEIGTPDIDNIDERIARLEEEINNILTTEPYTYAQVLSSPEQIDAKLEEITCEIQEYSDYREELTEVLKELLDEGGTPTWKTA
ncbi:MAG: hypothetical protein J6Z43_06490 [Clostridiales bacterium]|nr:hypothetical protein [Clostridiales bacterium]